MTAPHISFNPLSLAQESLQMAQKTKGNNSDLFQKLALITMCTIVVGTSFDVLSKLWMQLHPHEHREVMRQDKSVRER